MASSTSNSTKHPAYTARCCFLNLRQNSRHGVRTCWLDAATTGWGGGNGKPDSGKGVLDSDMINSLETDTGVDHGIQHVDHQVDENEFQREQQDLGLDHRVVAHLDGIHQQ